jgi:mannonate dehydratase
MYLGTQQVPQSEDDLRVYAQLGLTRICNDPPGPAHGWTRDDLRAHQDRLDRLGLGLEMVELPMSARPIAAQASPDILTAGPRRDEQIDSICRLISDLGAVGIPAAKYNLNILGVVRTEPEPGRGGSRNAAFRWDAADKSAPPTLAGTLDADTLWERIDYFLERVVPVAEESNVRLACHPHDPYTPAGWRGITRVLGSVEGLKQFVALRESPCHGLNFCQGSIAAMLDDPDAEIDEVIRYFGERDKIFNVHFRNIRGRRLSFVETFPEEGDMDMWRTLQVYHAVGYRHMIMPDHVPSLSGERADMIAFSYCYGYIRGLLQALEGRAGTR